LKLAREDLGDKAKDAGFKEGRENEFRFEEYHTNVFYRMLRMYTLEAILQRSTI